METHSREPQYKRHGVDAPPIMIARTIVFCMLPIVAVLVGTSMLRQWTIDTPIAPFTRGLYYAAFAFVGASLAIPVGVALLNRRHGDDGPPRTGIGLGWFTMTFRHKWLELDDAVLQIEWTKMHRWPMGGTISRGRRCSICGYLVLDAIDAEGRWCALYAGFDSRHWISWMGGAFAGIAFGRTRTGRANRLVGGLWRIESEWIRDDTPQPDVPGPSFTWRSRSSTSERIHALDTFSRDIILYRNLDHDLEGFVIAGPFMMWAELPVLISTHGEEPARAA